MKEKIIFKVVSDNGCELISAIIQKKYSVIYKPNIWIKPKIGKIFAFKSQKTARKFTRMYSYSCQGKPSLQIWKAVGKNLSEISLVGCTLHILGFWDGQRPDKHYPAILKMKPPEGTVLVDEIKLLELIA